MPPVSSRTTSRSVPSTTSRRSGLASSSASTARTGRRLAYRPSALRSPSSPCSGRGALGSVLSHFGPPTAASSTASACAARGQRLVGQRRAVRVDRGAAERVLGEGEVAQTVEDLEGRGGDLGTDPVPRKNGDAHSHGAGSLWCRAVDDGRDRRGAQPPRAARGRAAGAARGRAPRGRERAPALRPPGRARAPGDGGRRLQRGDGDRAGAGRGDRPRLRAHALAGRPRLSRRPGDRHPAPDRHLVPRGRGALRDLPRRQRAAGARALAAEPRHGQRRVGVGDRHRRGAGLPSRRDRPRGGAARGLRLPDPHRHAAGRRARVLHRAVRPRRIPGCCT